MREVIGEEVGEGREIVIEGKGRREIANHLCMRG